jgi:hypothetical protein
MYLFTMALTGSSALPMTMLRRPYEGLQVVNLPFIRA